MKVFITGANGFVGSHLTQALLDRGHSLFLGVRALKTNAAESCVEIGDITEPLPTLSRDIAGVEVVVHLAGFAHQAHNSPIGKQRCYQINVEGTRNIVELALKAGARKCIYLSSVKAHGKFPQGRQVQDGEPDVPQDIYGLSKLQAEKVASDLCVNYGAQFIALRPTMIYGSQVKANFLKLINLACSGLPLPFARLENMRSICFVENLSSLIERLCGEDIRFSGTFYTADPIPFSTKEMLTILADEMGVPLRLFPVPKRILQKMTHLPLIGDRADKLIGDLAVSTKKIANLLQWKAPFSSEEGLRKTAAWYKTQNTQFNNVH